VLIRFMLGDSPGYGRRQFALICEEAGSVPVEVGGVDQRYHSASAPVEGLIRSARASGLGAKCDSGGQR